MRCHWSSSLRVLVRRRTSTYIWPVTASSVKNHIERAVSTKPRLISAASMRGRPGTASCARLCEWFRQNQHIWSQRHGGAVRHHTISCPVWMGPWLCTDWLKKKSISGRIHSWWTSTVKISGVRLCMCADSMHIVIHLWEVDKVLEMQYCFRDRRTSE